MTVLVTGAGGYIGSILVPKLLDRGYRVKALDRFYFGTTPLSPHPRLRIIQEDCRRMGPEIFAGVQAVIDLAAICNDPEGHELDEVTHEINHIARVRTAAMAKRFGVKRYILPSSCSVYGLQKQGTRVDEKTVPNPLTAYGQANRLAEIGILKLSDHGFAPVVLRQATVYGVSPRMRFDLFINAMALDAWKTGKMRIIGDGAAWRPAVHIEDTTDVMCLLLEAELHRIQGEIFNVGSDKDTRKLEDFAAELRRVLPGKPEFEAAGGNDQRSYQVDFGKIERKLGWRAGSNAGEGALEVYSALRAGSLTDHERTHTIRWYKELQRWHRLVRNAERYGGILELEDG